MEEVMRRKRYYQAHYSRRAEHVYPRLTDWTASADDRWKDRVIVIVGIVVRTFSSEIKIRSLYAFLCFRLWALPLSLVSL